MDNINPDQNSSMLFTLKGENLDQHLNLLLGKGSLNSIVSKALNKDERKLKKTPDLVLRIFKYIPENELDEPYSQRILEILNKQGISSSNRAIFYEYLEDEIKNDKNRIMNKINQDVLNNILKVEKSGFFKRSPRKANSKSLLALAYNNGFKDSALKLINKSTDFSVVAKLIENGVDKSGETALIWACHNGLADLAFKLLDKVEDLNFADKEGNTALIWACNNGLTDLALKLIEEGAEINTANKKGETALIVACINSLPNVSLKLIDTVVNVDKQDNDGNTALLSACRAGLRGVGSELLEKGANGNIANNSGETPLPFAIYKGLKKLTSDLLEKGVDFNTVEKNALRINALLDEYRIMGEDWKNNFSPGKYFFPNRLQPEKVMMDCLVAFVEINAKGGVELLDPKVNVLVEKKIVKPATEVITTGDLHGDAFSLVKMLDKLREDGKLGADFKLKEDVELIFLGDYVDRGPDSWAILNILSRLKLNNMDNVHLIRGNHEEVGQINQEGASFGIWLPIRRYDNEIEAFFNRLPNAVFLGVEYNGKTEYDIYTHGAMPLKFNPKTLHEKSDGFYPIPRMLEKEYTFSHLTPNKLGENDSPIKMTETAEKVRQAVLKCSRKYMENAEPAEFYAWEWGDVKVDEKSSGPEREFSITIEDLKNWMNYVEEEIENVKIRRFFKGHSHVQDQVRKGDHEFYLLDTDLYKGKEFVMQSHKMGGEAMSHVYARTMGEDFSDPRPGVLPS